MLWELIRKESGPSKLKKIVADEGIPLSSDESGDEEMPKVAESVAKDVGKLVKVTELASSRLFISEEDRVSGLVMLNLLATAAYAGKGYSEPHIYCPVVERLRGRRVSERWLMKPLKPFDAEFLKKLEENQSFLKLREECEVVPSPGRGLLNLILYCKCSICCLFSFVFI